MLRALKSEKDWPTYLRISSWFPALIITIETLGEMDIHESNHPTKAKVAAGQLHKTVEAGYVLYLDSNNNAYDGHWIENESQGLRGIDFAWFGAGKGTDAEYPERMGNPALEFSILQKLIQTSSKLKCQNVFFKN